MKTLKSVIIYISIGVLSLCDFNGWILAEDNYDPQPFSNNQEESSEIIVTTDEEDDNNEKLEDQDNNENK